jgi:transcriptional regulator with XRE-family HTH domain
MRRIMQHKSQTELAEAIGLTFQQVQKYEKGANSVSAKRLQQIGDFLQVPPAFFFDGADGVHVDGEMPQYLIEFMGTSQGQHIVEAFGTISDKKVRYAIAKLIASIAAMKPRKRKGT